MKRIITLCALLCGAAAALAAADVGKPAPEFTGTDINGQTHKLSDYKGKIVILESYNQGCPYCHNHYRSGAMQDLQKELTSKGVVWLIVDSVGARNPGHLSPEAARKQWADSKINATAWLDDGSGEIGRAYGMRTTPHMFVIDQNGELAYQGAIDDRPESDGDPRTAKHNYVREAVQQLLAGEKVTVTQTKSYGCGVKYGT
ncbi:Alkyl hydroperoxide reductase/ Thiol specific antioxidant/ Mal allergen [Verrucomicrobia bacterium]|nr:Alkyl hydroperoxide reductase/ Thiol specific antioxidant/ Mal allergen [Verrucomicrobiota bacterium]